VPFDACWLFALVTAQTQRSLAHCSRESINGWQHSTRTAKRMGTGIAWVGDGMGMMTMLMTMTTRARRQHKSVDQLNVLWPADEDDG